MDYEGDPRNTLAFGLRETRALQHNRKMKIFHMRAPQAQGNIGLRVMRGLQICVEIIWKYRACLKDFEMKIHDETGAWTMKESRRIRQHLACVRRAHLSTIGN